MAISLASCAQRARDRLTEMSEAAGSYSLASIKGLIPTALEGFARIVADDPNLQQHLRPTIPFAATVTAGVADLTVNIAAPNRILIDKIHLGDIRLNPDTLGFPFHWVGDPALLAFQRLGDSMYVSYGVEGVTLSTRNIDGDLVATLGAISLSVPFIPVVAAAAVNSTLPFALEGAFISYLAQQAIHLLQPRTAREQAAA